MTSGRSVAAVMHVSSAFLLLVVASSPSAAQEQPQSGSAAIESVEDLIRLGLYRRAESVARERLKSGSSAIRSWEQLRRIGIASQNPELLEESLASLVRKYAAACDKTMAIKRLEELRIVAPDHDLISEVHSLFESRAIPRAPLASLRCIVGSFVILFIAWLFSTQRDWIRLRTVLAGLGLVLCVAIVFLPNRSPARIALTAASAGVSKVLSFIDAGALFVLGNLYRGAATETSPAMIEVRDGTTGDFIPLGFVFAFHVLLSIVFLSSITALLYHFGLMQWAVGGMARLMVRVMGTSGAESLVAAANAFLGHTEAPLLARPYLALMTRSEIAAVMTTGFGTVSVAAIAAYSRLGISAGDLLVANLMSVPTALVIAKILFPECEVPQTLGVVRLSIKREYVNAFDAIASGATLGIHVAVKIGAVLIAFIAMITMIDAGLAAVGGWTGFPLSVGVVLGCLFTPVAWLLGAGNEELIPVARLLGLQVAVNEFVAYRELSVLRASLSDRTYTVAVYALCGFCNFGSIAMQIGALGGMAPARLRDLAGLGLRAMWGGVLASWLTACIAGIFL